MPARSHAQKAFTFSKLPKGSLRLSDLGYFNLGEFKKNGEEEKYWFSRLHLRRATFDEEGKALNLLQWLMVIAGLGILHYHMNLLLCAV